MQSSIGSAWLAVSVLIASGCSEPTLPPAAEAPLPSVSSEPNHFAARVGQGRPTVVEFGARACAGCREMKVVLERLRITHGTQIGIAEIDPLEQREAIRHYRVQVMPTQIFFDENGRETGRHVGVIDGRGILMRLGVRPGAS